MTWSLTTEPADIAHLTELDNVEYHTELELASGEYPILKLEDGVLQVAIHPDDMQYLFRELRDLPDEGARLVFSMGSVATHGLEGVRRIESMPGLDVYMLGYITAGHDYMEAIAIP